MTVLNDIELFAIAPNEPNNHYLFEATIKPFGFKFDNRSSSFVDIVKAQTKHSFRSDERRPNSRKFVR